MMTKQQPITNSLFETINGFDTSLPFSIPSDDDQCSSSSLRLKTWNDDIEEIFMKGDETIDNKDKDMDKDNKDNVVTTTTVEQVANALHALIIQMSHSLYEPNLKKGDGDDEKEEDNNGSKLLSNLNCSFQNNNNDANDVTMSLAQQIISNYESKSGTINENYDSRNREALPQIHAISLLSQLIRASKNLIRWNRVLLSQAKLKRNAPPCQISSLESCHRLCSPGMVKLYLTLLEINSQSEDHDTTPNFDYRLIRDDLAMHSCTALFHSTYGEAKEPISKLSLREFISSKSNIYGIPSLARLLLSSTSVQVMLVLIRLVHNLVGSVPGIMAAIDTQLEAMVDAEKKKNFNAEEKEEMTQQQQAQQQTPPTLFSILVSTLAWSIRSNPPFPGKKQNSKLDRRSEISIETIRVLFALQNRHQTSFKKVNESNPEIMTQLGIIMTDILNLSNHDPRVYECKVTVLILLMDAPREYSHFLQINHCIESLLTILWIQLNEAVIENDGRVQDQQSAVSMLPILIVLNKLALENKAIKTIIKNEIFPPEREEMILAKLTAASSDSSSSNSNSNSKGNSSDGDTASSPKSQHNINPIDAPPSTTRWKLIKLMTWTESNVKRCASEFLWTICEGDSKEFVARTGFGNAVHMLGIRGLVNIPSK